MIDADRRRVIDQACRAAASWPEPITVAHQHQAPGGATRPRFPNAVSKALARHNSRQPDRARSDRRRVPRRQRFDARCAQAAARARGRDRARRFRTGYSSIGYLNKAVFHKLKIDGGIIQRPGRGRRTWRSSSRSSSSPRAPAVDHRQGHRNRRGLRSHGGARVRHHPGLSVRQAAALRAGQPDGRRPRHPAGWRANSQSFK